MSINANNDALNEILEVINDLPISKDEQSKTIDITENGTTVVTPDEGMTLGEVTVNVEVESGGGEAEGIQFLEFDDIYHHYPTKVKLNFTPRRFDEGTFVYAFYCGTGNTLFGRMKEIYLPEGITSISKYMFNNCGQLATIHADFSSVNHILDSAFSGCKSLTEFPYFPNLIDVRSYAFRNCTGLTTVKFHSILSVVAAGNMFSGCTNITDIYVPWALDEVDGAPWGATNATIHYNTTYDEDGNPECPCHPATEV